MSEQAYEIDSVYLMDDAGNVKTITMVIRKPQVYITVTSESVGAENQIPCILEFSSDSRFPSSRTYKISTAQEGSVRLFEGRDRRGEDQEYVVYARVWDPTKPLVYPIKLHTMQYW